MTDTHTERAAAMEATTLKQTPSERQTLISLTELTTVRNPNSAVRFLENDHPDGADGVRYRAGVRRRKSRVGALVFERFFTCNTKPSGI
jgi:hypothetical protein